MQTEAWTVIREIMDHELTDRQRQALEAIVFEDVPLDQVAEHWDSNRNATYKLLHDARRKLKAGLETRGYRFQDLLDLFSA
jgi:RNA polymerase sigma-70 factor (ECF subfamily)